MVHKGPATESGAPGKITLDQSIAIHYLSIPFIQGAMAVIKWAQLPITIDQWSTEISAQMELMRKCKLLPGVPKLLSTLAKCQDPKLHLAIASSAGRSLFDIKTSNFSEVFDVIPQHCRFFGNDPEMQGKGKKPAPDVFLLALSRINESLGKDEEKVLPEQCLVFEDSTAGVEAGRRARMQVVWVPHPGLLGVYEGREDVVLEGTTDEYHEQLVNYEDAANGQLTNEHNGGSEHRQSITSSKDGRAKMLNSLEDFPYAEYGIKV